MLGHFNSFQKSAYPAVAASRVGRCRQLLAGIPVICPEQPLIFGVAAWQAVKVDLAPVRRGAQPIGDAAFLAWPACQFAS